MRVLMTTDTVGGVWHYALELVRALAAHGVRVDLATMGAPLSDDQRARAGEVLNLRLFESTFKLEWESEPWDDVDQAGEWLLRIARETRPDLVHFNHFCSAHLDFGVPKLVVVHSDVLSWFRAVRGEHAPAEWATYARRVERGLRAADLVIAPTHAMLDSARGDYGPLHGAAVIPNGRDGDLFPTEKDACVLTCGRLWDDAKNVAAVDAAAAGLPWPVFAAGAGGDERMLAHARWLGNLDASDLAAWMNRAAVFAAPVRYEPFGLAILEAASRGCALVLGDIPSLRENWSDAAIFVDPLDPRSLRMALESLIADPAWRLELGSRAHARARRFSSSRMGARYADAYGRLTSATLARVAP